MACLDGFQFLLRQHVLDVLPGSATRLVPKGSPFDGCFPLCEDRQTKNPVSDHLDGTNGVLIGLFLLLRSAEHVSEVFLAGNKSKQLRSIFPPSLDGIQMTIGY